MESLKKVGPNTKKGNFLTVKTTDLLKYLRPLVAIGLLAYLFSRVPLGQIATTLKGIKPIWLIFATFISLLAISTSAWKLLKLVNLTLDSPRFQRILRAYYIGYFFNNFLPTSVGGDVVKANELKKEGLSISKAGASVIVERGSGLLVISLLTLIFAAFWSDLFQKFELIYLRFPIIIAGFLGIFSLIPLYVGWQNRIKPFLKKRTDHYIWGRVYKILESFFVFRNNFTIFGPILLLSLTFYALGALNLVVISKALRANLNFWYALGAIPVTTFISLLPISLGALGLREGAIVYCLSHLGLTPAEAMSVALLHRFVTYIHSAVGGIIYGLNKTI